MPRRPTPTVRGPERLEDRVNPAPFTLQILHASDFEAGIAAVTDAPNFAAIVDRLEDQSPTGNSITLSSGDNYIPGPFFNAGGDPSLNGAGLLGTASVGRADVEILNRVGVRASALGNHEFDAGPREVLNIIAPAGTGAAAWRGAQFPYLSSNLAFNGGDLGPRVVAAGQNTSAITPGRIAPSVVITENGQNIGVIGLTTPLLENISSPGPNITVNPANDNDLPALAAFVQAQVDAFTAAGVNTIVLTSHLQQIGIEQALAPLLSGVDVIIAGGSNTRLADSTDVLRAGETADGDYPLVTAGADGNPTLIVNTDGNYKYVGRLVFTVETTTGLIDLASLDPAVNGAYATDPAGVDRVYAGSGLDPFAAGTRGAGVRQIAQAIGNVISAKDSQVFGQASVYLNGLRAEVRTEETNLGSVSADANLFAANRAGQAAVISIKNGGGVRDSVGSVSEEGARAPTVANPSAGKLAGQISRLDVENSLRFNNLLSVVSVPASGLQVILEHAVAAVAPGATPGQFGQVGGVRFSFDATRPAQMLAGDTTDGVANITTVGERVRNAAIIDAAGNVVEVLIRDGVLVGDPARLFRLVTLNFLADEGAAVDGLGGDNYPIPSFDSNRVNLSDPAGLALGEQQAFIDYLRATFPAGGPATLSLADTPAGRDGRIQNLAARAAVGLADTVLAGALTPTVTVSAPTILEDSPFVPLSGTIPTTITVTRNAGSGAEVEFYRVTAVVGGTLFVLGPTDQASPVADGDFVAIDQVLAFAPAPNFNGQAGFTVQASLSDAPAGLGGSAVPVSITVTPVNDAPTAAPLSVTTTEDGPVSGRVAITDVDSSVVSAAGQVSPANGTAVVLPDGSFTYTPNADFSGTDTFVIGFTDGFISSQVAVTVTVTPVNDAPLPVVVIELVTAEDTPLGGSVATTDPDGGAVTYAVATPPANGTLVLNADGTFTYTPYSDFAGLDRFAVTASDPSGASTTTSLLVNVTPVNDAPVAVGDTFTVPAGVGAVFVAAPGVLNNDRDVDNPITEPRAFIPGLPGVPALAAVLVAGPAAGQGTLTFNRDGSFVFTPAAGFAGTATFTYRVTDGTFTSEPATVSITVPPAPPVPPVPPVPPSPPSPPVPPVPPAPVDRPADQNEVGAFAVSSATDGAVAVFDAAGNETRRLTAFAAGEAPGGVRAVVADFTGDGVADTAVGTGPGVAGAVRVFDGATGRQVGAFDAFEAAFTGGVFLAAADFDGDGRAELVVTADNGGGPRVRVVSAAGTVRADFFGIEDPAFRGGARPTVGDVNGDGTPDLVVAAGVGGGPRVAVFDGARLFAVPPAGALPAKLVGDFFVFEEGVRDGAFVAAGDVNGDGRDDVIGGGGPGGGPRVFGLSGAGLLAGRRDQVLNFFAGPEADRSGVRVAVKDLDGDARADVVTAGAGAVRAYAGRTITPTNAPAASEDLFPFGPDFAGGVFVG